MVGGVKRIIVTLVGQSVLSLSSTQVRHRGSRSLCAGLLRGHPLFPPSFDVPRHQMSVLRVEL